MPNDTACLVLDTNVWLEKYIPWRSRREVVLRLLSAAQSRGCAIAFPSQAALDVYQKVCRENKLWARKHGALTEPMAQAIKRMAWDCVNEMRELATPVPVDSTDLYLACKYRDIHDDLEDDLVLAACQRVHADYLVTLDRKLLAHSPVEAVTPEQMLELIRSGVALAPASADGGNDRLLAWLSTL